MTSNDGGGSGTLTIRFVRANELSSKPETSDDALGLPWASFPALGSVRLGDDTLWIVDRTEHDEYTRLDVHRVLSLVRYILNKKIYTFDNLVIYLPRMSTTLLKEAAVQEQFYRALKRYAPAIVTL